MQDREMLEIEKDLDKGIWIPQWLIENKNFTWTKKYLYAEIMQLEELEHGCTASNSHFAKKFGLTPAGVSKALNEMAKDEYIFIDNAQVKRNHGKRQITINCGKSPRQETINSRKSAINSRKSAINSRKKTIGNKPTTKPINKPSLKKEEEKREVLERIADSKFRQLISELFLQVKSKSKITSLANGTKNAELNEVADRAYVAYKAINDTNKEIISNYKKLEDLYIKQNKIQMLPRIENFLLDYELKVLELSNTNTSNRAEETLYEKSIREHRERLEAENNYQDTEIFETEVIEDKRRA